jgi:hypothetical protein
MLRPIDLDLPLCFWQVTPAVIDPIGAGFSETQDADRASHATRIRLCLFQHTLAKQWDWIGHSFPMMFREVAEGVLRQSRSHHSIANLSGNHRLQRIGGYHDSPAILLSNQCCPNHGRDMVLDPDEDNFYQIMIGNFHEILKSRAICGAEPFQLLGDRHPGLLKEGLHLLEQGPITWPNLSQRGVETESRRFPNW